MNDAESLYTTENFVPSGFEKVIEQLTKSAEQGSAIAQLNLGLCYANGYCR